MGSRVVSRQGFSSLAPDSAHKTPTSSPRVEGRLDDHGTTCGNFFSPVVAAEVRGSGRALIFSSPTGYEIQLVLGHREEADFGVKR